MTVTRTRQVYILFMVVLFALSGCSTMNLEYDEPRVELVSFKVLPASGLEQNFAIGLKLTNPNSFDVPFNGISYELSVAGKTLAYGASSDIPTAAAYSESRFEVPISTNLLSGIKVISSLMSSKGKDISYQLKAKLDIDIPFVPVLTIIEDGKVPFDHKSL